MMVSKRPSYISPRQSQENLGALKISVLTHSKNPSMSKNLKKTRSISGINDYMLTNIPGDRPKLGNNKETRKLDYNTCMGLIKTTEKYKDLL